MNMFFSCLKQDEVSPATTVGNLEIKHGDGCRALHKILSWLLANPCKCFLEHIHVYKHVQLLLCAGSIVSIVQVHVHLGTLIELIPCTYSGHEPLLGMCPKAKSSKALLTFSAALFEEGKFCLYSLHVKMKKV